ncbi:hypothetical protein V6N13_082942 [Hibiscus sabdariffa]|uniref:Uncharacterized protein n=1 Tax=Hibiscus sabdariffa TaxID=183260 RepID=A0ABR2BZG8_9ROSI
MIMILSVHSVVGDAAAATSSTPAKGAAHTKVAAGPAADAPSKKHKDESSSWTAWAKAKLSGIGSIFSSSSPSRKAPAPAPAPAA